ncbi:helicase HerA-like C-terminal domain-containing protein [Cupriavidus taiwanensis]|uniref:Enzyme, nucleoside triP hydrolase domain n=1 Tax=Cupriavidus taiwanensis (strain DSM 17343 / BCRC 17206 / CCUG 44338 / CIP 107171 / LMG 19424 / R1) TaxID=977880 RepID=B3R3E5_CUPTR|nr:helicase HerA-like C-terminal domain-containing protein [Cupriavidus taiwanensis]CAQ68827.1 putative enzyme, nucleoside triP hydrolase domain [Cupriavidus taiwanensis LMG 19424]
MADPILIAKNAEHELVLLPQMGNRHGLITGATGTGKTVTLQTLAQGFSRLGVPVFMADVKGDLTGISQAAGQPSDKLKQRLADLNLPEPVWGGCPTTLWDVFGEKGHPVRATVSHMGPLLLSRMLELNDTQQGVLNLVFRIADANGLLLLDAKDLRAMLQYVGDNAGQFTTEYGNISAASIGAIQRGLIALESQGGDVFFGEPMLNLEDFIQTDKGQGVVNILAADKLMNSSRLYATFLLWMLSELFEKLPEAGDLDKPKLVFFFDEAHLLFNDAPKALLDKIEQVVRLVRSKGVGVYFVTQNPVDIPDTVLGQLGNRVQHALRAFTPRDQKAVKVAATTMRANPKLDLETAIGELGVGEALVSFLDAKGTPCVTERAWVVAPGSRIGPATEDERKQLIANSLVAGTYEKTVDRESAYEKLRGSVPTVANGGKGAGGAQAGQPAGEQDSGWLGTAGEIFGTLTKGTGKSGRGDSILESMAKSAARTVGSQVGRELIRGVLGSLLGKKK